MCELALPDGNLMTMPGIDLVTAFGLLAVELPTLAIDFAAGDFSPTIEGFWEIINGIEGINFPDITIPGIFEPDISLEIPGLDPSLALEIGIEIALAAGAVVKGIMLDLPVEFIMNPPTGDLIEWVAGLIPDIVAPEAALNLAGCIAELLS